MIPHEWTEAELGDAASFKGGSAFKEIYQGRTSGDLPFIKVSDMNLPGNEREIHVANNWITEAEAKYMCASPMPTKAIVFAKVGAALMLNKRRRLVRPTIIDNNMMAAIPNERRISSDYLLLYLRTIDLGRVAQASAVPSVNQQQMAALPVLLPPLQEQHKISEILSVWDGAIETVEALIANARQQKEALMQALLTGKRRLPEFHEDWAWVRFADVFHRVREKNDVGDTNILTISAQHGLVSQTDYFNKIVASDDVRGYTLLRRGDFAYNKSYSDGYPFGAFKPLDRYDRGIVSSLYICFRLASADHDHDFMRHYFEAGLFNREVARIAQEGARNHGLLNVSVVDFFNALLHTPCREEQVAIATVINNAEGKEQMLIKQRGALRDEKSALMQQLLTGKRRVKVAESEAA
jgi:type I restriction enzyme S subunit